MRPSQSASSIKIALSRPISDSAPQRLPPRLGLVILLLGFGLLGILLVTQQRPAPAVAVPGRHGARRGPAFNGTYPATAPVTGPQGEVTYRFAVIADLDKDSQTTKGKEWSSILHRGRLTRSKSGKYTVAWDAAEVPLHGALAEKGRGLELSELQFFNGHLYTVDDRTGIVYEILDNTVVARAILADGDGTFAKGFKAEWMAVKDQQLWLGSMGKEWTTPTGEIVNLNPQWVKVLTPSLAVRHVPWASTYNALRLAAQMPSPGYLLHESAAWSAIHKRWFFLPRRASKEKYDDTKDERRGANLLISADEGFKDVKVSHLGSLNPTLGFSSFKFVPGTGDAEVVALKTKELDGEIESYIAVYDVVRERTLLEPTRFSDKKFEGVEFI